MRCARCLATHLYTQWTRGELKRESTITPEEVDAALKKGHAVVEGELRETLENQFDRK